jgi:hypothetical protein
MNGSPIKPVSARVETPTTPPPSSVSGSPRVGESAPSADADAASVSVASTKSRGLSSNDPSEAVDSLLKGIESSSSLAEAHGRLDPARVFGLLNDEEEDSETR